MRKTPIYAALVAGISALLGTHSAPVTAGISPAQLAALDPTRPGRTACIGKIGPGTTLDRRLAMARARATALGMGTATIPLYEGIMPSRIPSGGIAGEARKYFDQGMALTYGFNHAAAIRSFKEALQLDSGCAMCWWGIANASAPNINAPLTAAQNAVALDALANARHLAKEGTPEAQLIAIQSLRFTADFASDRGPLDKAYSDAMLAFAAAHPANDDVAVLAAESAMTTTPWYYWDDATKAPQPRIAEAVRLIDSVIKRNPGHPQAAHLYIHLMENGPDPRLAENAADTLAKSTPPALGHLVHMPSHIYFRIGRYKDSMEANILAARIDEKYLATVGDDGMVRFGYYPHNVHFLLASAQMVGNMHAVMQETSRLNLVLNEKVASEMAWVQAIHTAPSFALAQYASPAATLALTEKPSTLAYVEAMRHYARAVAHAYAKDSAGFAKEIAALDKLADAPGATGMLQQGFPAPDLIRLAGHVARGRQASAGGKYREAIAHFEAAEAIEAKIPYNEPPYWYYPVAQSRGAALYRAGDYAGASKAFRKALFIAPNNGWALFGLAKSEGRLGHKAEAMAARAKLDEVWQGNVSWLKMERL